MIARFDQKKKKQTKGQRSGPFSSSSQELACGNLACCRSVFRQNTPGPGILVHRGHFQRLCLTACLKTLDEKRGIGLLFASSLSLFQKAQPAKSVDSNINVIVHGLKKIRLDRKSQQESCQGHFRWKGPAIATQNVWK